MKKIIFIIMLFTYMFSNSLFSSKNAFALAKANSITAEIVMDVNSGRILHQRNIDEKMFMASTTKILTALTIIENCNLSDKVLIKKETVGVEGSSIYLREGEELTVKELLYGLMLRSGNDCAESLAIHCCNSIENFANLMNETAKRIGANNSNFVNPHGLHDDNHYTTAYDLAKISCYAMKNDIFREIVSTKKIKISNGENDCPRVLINKNKMLYNVENCTGIKTGYTKKSGRCLVSSVKNANMELVCVVLNCGPMYEVSKELINHSFSLYKPVKILDSNNIFDFINLDKTSKKYSIYIKNDVVIPLKDDEVPSLKIVPEYYDYNQYIKNKTGEIGVAKICVKNNLIFSVKLFSI